MRPKTLKVGDEVAIIATAKKIDAQYIKRAVSLLESWGLRVHVGKYVLESYHQFAGTDEQRAHDLQWSISHPTIKGIICARGGYGTVRIVDQIDFSALRQHPKWIIGFSDVTVLHNHIHTHLDICTIHGTVPLNFPFSGTNENLESLKHLLFEGSITYQVNPHRLNRLGEVSAQLVGGNLAMLESLAGTNSDIDTRGKILFLEEISEYAYRVDRMLWNLKKGGKLDQLKGLVVGGFTDIKEGKDHFGWDGYELVSEITKDYDFPICFDFPAGHQSLNKAFMLGAKTSLTITDNSVHFQQ